MSGSRSVADASDPVNRSILLADYAAGTVETDILGPELPPVLQGLFGEVGGVMSTAKKVTREGTAYAGHRRAAEEEFGDALWYITALCRRLEIPLEELFCDAVDGGSFRLVGAASDMAGGALAKVTQPVTDVSLDVALFRLARSTGELMSERPERQKLVAFATAYLDALNATDLSFADIAHGNLRKARGAFLPPSLADLVDFDDGYGSEEQLPRRFEIRINQRSNCRSYLRWNGVFIGDPLTDNIEDPDGYRFHDVFHFAYAAILHWSPVMRALIQHKRKSRPDVDETQDGGRAIVVEEGLSAWIFARAKELDFFAGQDRVSLGILKTIGEFVSGYEVSRCPLKLWERAILDGFAVFRQLREERGGWVVGDRTSRTIRFESLGWKD
jgi:hypothetical protein